LRFAAGLQGLALVRTGDTYALAEIKMRGATLDEIATYLDGDDVADDPAQDRRADLRALRKAEHAMLAAPDARARKLDETRTDHDRPADDQATTEAALAEIRRRIAELSEARQNGAPGGPIPDP